MSHRGIFNKAHLLSSNTHHHHHLSRIQMSFCVCLSCVSPEVPVTSLYPPRLCRLAVFSIKPTFFHHRMSHRGIFISVKPTFLSNAGFPSIFPLHLPFTTSSLLSTLKFRSLRFHSPRLCRIAVISSSRGRLPVGLDSSNKIPVPYKPTSLSSSHSSLITLRALWSLAYKHHHPVVNINFATALMCT